MAWVAPIVRMPFSYGMALWKALLSGSSTFTVCQPLSVFRTMSSLA